MTKTPLTIGQRATLACLIEASAPKVGNVHPGASFDDMTFVDFLASAVAIGPAFERAAEEASLGDTVLDAVKATREAVGKNTNLGSILLLAPLALAKGDELSPSSVAAVLSGLTAQDAADVYQAIRMARPGGLGEVDSVDVHDEPPPDLIAAMRLAAGRDLVARQYANGFEQVFQEVVPALIEANRRWPLLPAIVYVQLQLMDKHPDTLIARKCGQDMARQASERAAAVLECGVPGESSYGRALAEFDAWLRADGHRRNPGAIADLLAAGLFVTLH